MLYMGRRVARRVGMAALAVGALTAVGCDAGTTGPADEQVASIAGNTSVITSLVGIWRAAILEEGVSFADTWIFKADGTAGHGVNTPELALGSNDVAITMGRWQIRGTRLIIEFVPGPSTPISYDFAILGNTLVLGGRVYVRVQG